MTLAGLLTYSPQAHAGPWVDTDDVLLRISIQQLADAGYFNTTVSTYPLMWYSIARDMREIDVTWLTETELYAYYRIRAALDFAQRDRVTGSRAQLSSADPATEMTAGAFGSRQREKAVLSTWHSRTGEHVAVRVQSNVRSGMDDSKRLNFEGSYIATTLGNWSLSIDQQPVWWGPGQENALVLSDNSLAFQALRATRLDDLPPAYLSWLGSVNSTVFVGRGQAAASRGDHQVAGGRVNLRPWGLFELGFSHLTHWRSYGDFYNNISGVDLRLPLASRLAVYAELATNHGNDERMAYTVGSEYRFGSRTRHFQTFIEYTDVSDTFYEQNLSEQSYFEPDGYRRWQRIIGAGVDQDVNAYTVGLRSQHRLGSAFEIKAQYMELGAENWVSRQEYSADGSGDVERYIIALAMRRPVGESVVSVGTTFIHDKFGQSNQLTGASGTRSSNVNFTLSWEYRY